MGKNTKFENEKKEEKKVQEAVPTFSGSIPNELTELKGQLTKDSQRLNKLESNMKVLLELNEKNKKMMKNISSSEEKITWLRNDLQSLFQQVQLALEASKGKLEKLDDIVERIEALEEEQHQLISDVQSKISNVPPLTWTIASVGIPLGILGWYS